MAYGKSSGGMGSQYGRGNSLAAALAPDAAAIGNIKGNTQGIAYALQKGLQGLFAGMDAKDQSNVAKAFNDAFKKDKEITMEAGSTYVPELEDAETDVGSTEMEPVVDKGRSYQERLMANLSGLDSRYANDAMRDVSSNLMAREQAMTDRDENRGYRAKLLGEGRDYASGVAANTRAQTVADAREKRAHEISKAEISAGKKTTAQRNYERALQDPKFQQYLLNMKAAPGMAAWYGRAPNPVDLGANAPPEAPGPSSAPPAALPSAAPTGMPVALPPNGPPPSRASIAAASQQEKAMKATPAYKARVAREMKAAKPIPAAIQKQIESTIDFSKSTEGINADLMAFSKMIDEGTLDLGFFRNIESKGRQYFGQSDQVSRNYGAFITNLERLRNESLRLNKGIQTEGDAKRIWNEIIANPTDEKFVQQRISELIALNQRNIRNADSATTRYREEYGRDEMEARPPTEAAFQGAVPDTTLPTSDGWGIRKIK